MASVVFLGAPIYLVWRTSLPARWRWAATGFSVIVMIGIADARLYLDAHWVTDVLGGFTGGTSYLTSSIAWIGRSGHGTDRPGQ